MAQAVTGSLDTTTGSAVFTDSGVVEAVWDLVLDDEEAGDAPCRTCHGTGVEGRSDEDCAACGGLGVEWSTGW